MEGQKQLGMKWYKFFVYFGLWAGAILNIISAITMLTGSVYGSSEELVYSVFPDLKGIDVFFGLVLIGVAIFQGYTAYSLIKFKSIGPDFLTILYAALIAWELFYAIIAGVVTGASLIGEAIIPIVVSIIMMAVNYKYFNNREHLFVN